MSKILRNVGIVPGHDRDAADVNSQLTLFKAALGYTPDIATYPGSISEENFSRDAGIREDKISFLIGGHDHPYSANARGARLADKSVSDAQLAWHTADSPQFVRGGGRGMQVRFGFFTNYQILSAVANFEGSDPAVTGTTIDPARSPKYYVIPFSTGHSFDRNAGGVLTTQEAGAPFPAVGAIPTVLITPVVDDAGIVAPVAGTTKGDVHIAVVPGSVTYEDFAIVLDTARTGAGNTCRSSGFKGVNWIAIYDPTQEGL